MGLERARSRGATYAPTAAPPHGRIVHGTGRACQPAARSGRDAHGVQRRLHVPRRARYRPAPHTPCGHGPRKKGLTRAAIPDSMRELARVPLYCCFEFRCPLLARRRGVGQCLSARQTVSPGLGSGRWRSARTPEFCGALAFDTPGTELYHDLWRRRETTDGAIPAGPAWQGSAVSLLPT